MKIVVSTPQVTGHLDTVRNAAPEANVVEVATDAELLAEVVDAEILFTGHFESFSNQLLATAKQLKWVQVSAAGVEWLPKELVAKKGWQVTNAAGLHAIPVAETGVALLSGVARRLGYSVRNQCNGHWQPPAGMLETEQKSNPLYELFEKTAGIIAMGGIGRALAERLHGLGMRVIAVDVNSVSKPEKVDEIRGIDDLDWLLETADVVCMTAPDTPKSHHMMNAGRFAKMKTGSIFINVSRGGLVDTNALVNAIEVNKFFGVGLDVVEDEPLRSDHPIWDRENVLITPHIGGGSFRRVERLIKLFTENLRRYRSGEPLQNLVDLNAGF